MAGSTEIIRMASQDEDAEFTSSQLTFFDTVCEEHLSSAEKSHTSAQDESNDNATKRVCLSKTKDTTDTTIKPVKITLNQDQQFVFDEITQKDISLACLIGEAGCGKTQTARSLVEYYENLHEKEALQLQAELKNIHITKDRKDTIKLLLCQRPVSCISGTWSAATIIYAYGTTPHSGLGFKIGAEEFEGVRFLNNVGPGFFQKDAGTPDLNKYIFQTISRLTKAFNGGLTLPKIVMIDEVCAMTAEMIDLVVYLILKVARNMINKHALPLSFLPKILLIGDPLQLPAIIKDDSTLRPFYESNIIKHVFQSENVYYYKHNLRILHVNDKLSSLLTELRLGKQLSVTNMRYLYSFVRKLPSTSILQRFLVSGRRKQISDHNDVCMQTLRKRCLTKRFVVFTRSVTKPDTFKTLSQEEQYLLNSQCEQFMATYDESIRLCIGAKVWFIRKVNSFLPGQQYYVVGHTFLDEKDKDQKSALILRLVSNTTKEEEESMFDNDVNLPYKRGDIVCSMYTFEIGHAACKSTIFVECMPLEICFGTTTHKLQGVSIEDGIIVQADLDSLWMFSQLYVILSRMKNIDNLYLYGSLRSGLSRHDKGTIEIATRARTIMDKKQRFSA